MNSEWKVFIRGVEGRGKEVITTLVNLGANGDLMAGLGNNPNLIYYIRHNGNISFVGSDTETGKIIVDHYQEIKLPKQWNDGDILINNSGTYYRVFWKYDSDSDISFYAHNISMRVNGMLSYDSSVWEEKIQCFREDFRLATPSEVERFHELLHKLGTDWEAGTKQLVKWRWKPQKGENYWTVIVGITIYMRKLTWIGSAADEIRYELGNCFRTCNEADDMLKKVKLLFNKE